MLFTPLITDLLAEVVTNLLQIVRPILSMEYMNTEFWEPVKTVFKVLLIWMIWVIFLQAGSECHKLVEIFFDGALWISKCEEHRVRTLATADVEYLPHTSHSFDTTYQSGHIILCHLLETIVPEFRHVWLEDLVFLTILCSAWVADPDIVACLSKLQEEGKDVIFIWVALLELEPSTSIVVESRHDQDWSSSCWVAAICVSLNVEEKEVEAIFSLGRHCLPLEVVFLHWVAPIVEHFATVPGDRKSYVEESQ